MVGKVDDNGKPEVMDASELLRRVAARPPDAEAWMIVIEGLARGLSETAASTRAGVHVRLVRKRRKENVAFDEACTEAIEAGTDRLEDIAFERAAKTSDWLLIQLLKARRPEKFGDQVRVTERKEISWEPMGDADWSEKYGKIKK